MAQKPWTPDRLMVADLTINQRIAKEIFNFTNDHDWPKEDEGSPDHTIFKCIHCGILCDFCCQDTPTGKCYLNPRDYSGDLKVAFELVDHLRNMKPTCVTVGIQIKPEKGFCVNVFKHGIDTYGRWFDVSCGSITDDSLPNAIALGALMGIEACR